MDGKARLCLQVLLTDDKKPESSNPENPPDIYSQNPSKYPLFITIFRGPQRPAVSDPTPGHRVYLSFIKYLANLSEALKRRVVNM